MNLAALHRALAEHVPAAEWLLENPAIATAAILALAAGAVVLAFYLERRPAGLPGPPEGFFLQGTWEMMCNTPRVLDWFLECTERYDWKTWSFKWWGQGRVYFTQDPKNIEHILKTNFKNYGKGAPFRNRMAAMIGEGIFNTDGEKWYLHRKVSSNLFKVSTFRDGMVPTFNRHADALLALLGRVADGERIAYSRPSGAIFEPAAFIGAGIRDLGPDWSGGREPAGCVNVSDVMHRYTFDAIGSIAFGEDIGSLERPELPACTAFDYVTRYVSNDIFVPLWRVRRLLFPSGWRFRRAVRALDAFAYGIVRRRRRALRAGDGSASGASDLLSIFMTHSLPREKGVRLTDRYLRDLIVNFILAGRDTTAQALSWCFEELARRPDVQDRVRREVEEVCGAKAPAFVSFEEVEKLRYTDAVFRETLRLYPSVAKEAKIIVDDDVWPDGTEVRGGCWASFSPWVAGRSREFWGEDCLDFKPERFLGKTRPSPFVYSAFQAGPRVCLGQNMAFLEAKVVLARVLAGFAFSVPEEPRPFVIADNSLTLPTKSGIWLRVERRS